ncbi:MAG TPA: LysR family transcriptional regulator [Symbiobacteriaceae bacterium]|jgi:DNA-binding transcriptional LysR family regulator
MNKYLLEMFVTVVETRRITSAARLLNLTQPAVSQQIRHMEAYFGVTLLNREQQGVRPTPAGEILYNRARQILSQFDCLEREIDDLTRADEREVVIGATATAGNFVLPCSLWTFKDRFPKANLRLELGDNQELAVQMLDHTLHLAIIEGVVPERPCGTMDLKCRVISSDQVVLVTPVRGPWDKGRLTTELLGKAPLVLPGKGTGVRIAFEAALFSQGLTAQDLNIMGQMGGLEGMKAAAEAHGGVLVSARMAVAKELKRGHYRDVTPEWLKAPLPFHLIYAEELLPPVARRFIRFIAAPEELASCWE